jgi:autotransporter-associated beta strand protein
MVVDTTSNYTFTGTGTIDGGASLVKTNSGTLTMLAANNGYVGATVVSGGTLEVAKLANGGNSSSIGASGADASNLVLNGGNLRYLGATASSDRSITLNTNGILDIASNATILTLNGTLVGAGPFTKAGPGQLTLTTDSTFTNGATIAGGTLRINTLGGAGPAGITNHASTLTFGASGTLVNVVDFGGNCTIDLNNSGSDLHMTGAWSGNGTVNVVNQGNGRTFTAGGNGNGNDTAGHGNLVEFSGTINMGTSAGFLRFNDGSANYNFGSTNATIDLGTGSATFLVRNGGVTVDVGALAGGPNTRVTGRASGNSGTVVYSVGGKNISTLFEGTITNSTSGNLTAITKVGTGTWTLGGVSTYSGQTMINNGVLALSGSGALTHTPLIDILSIATLDTSGRTDGAITLNSGQVLSGEGTVRGGVIVSSGATLSPGENTNASPAGAATFGTMTITGALVLESGSTIIMDLDPYYMTNDMVTGLASVTYGGTLDLSRYNSAATAGQAFKLFSARAYSGAFETINPSTPAYNLIWDTSRLTVDGTLVASYPLPKFNQTVVIGSDLVMSGINGLAYGNYYVRSSTNVAAPLSGWTYVVTNMFNYDGSFSFTNTIDPAKPKEFFLLEMPQQ